MPKTVDRQNSILIVSGSESFDLLLRRALPQRKFQTADFRKSAAAARRSLLEKVYDVVVIHGPLPDELGPECAMDIAETYQSSVLLVIPSEIYDEVSEYLTDKGILVIAKPVSGGRIEKAIRFLAATQKRIHQYEKKMLSVEEKMQELRLVTQAKLRLMEKYHMSEEEAHRLIGREAMNHGVTRKRIAEKILDE